MGLVGKYDNSFLCKANSLHFLKALPYMFTVPGALANKTVAWSLELRDCKSGSSNEVSFQRPSWKTSIQKKENTKQNKEEIRSNKIA